MSKYLVPDSDFSVFLPCDICGNDKAGRGNKLASAKSSLGSHKRHKHGIAGTGKNNKNRPMKPTTSKFLSALGAYLEESKTRIE